MSIQRQLVADIELVNTLRLITQAYQEISVMRMKKMRIWVLAARHFLNELSDVFYDVRSSYKRQIEMVIAKKQKKQQLAAKEAKQLDVFISANSKLYGDIIDRVFKKFIEATKATSSDILIIGKLGKTLFDQTGIKRQYLYFEIPEAEVTVDDLKPIIFHLVKYEKINVYYGQFESVITQYPSTWNITGDQPLEMSAEDQNKSNSHPEAKFLFEPNLEQILDFFQTQVFSALFKQTVHEAHLAHFASRIRAMEEAINNIESARTKLYSERRRVRRMLENREVLGRIAGMTLWNQ